MCKNQMKKQRGITLIALVITIMVIVILAGVTLNLTVGENGIFSKAKYAKEKYINEEYTEQEQLNELYAYLAKDSQLPNNTKDTEAGTQVKLPSSWYSTTSAYISTKDGTTVKKAIKSSSVDAIATGNGETIPVPKGFYYVGGTKQSGVVISSDERDKNKYAGVENVPAGAVYNSDGTVKTYTDEEYKKLSDDEKKVVILGDQFVWIPVTTEEYTKTNWGDIYNYVTWEKQTNTAELPQIQKYEGFYIGRYEAGTSQITISNGTTNIDFAGANTATDKQNSNFSIIKEGNTLSGKITTKAGEIPYYHADYFTAHKLSERMYSTNYVQSGLVTGTMWDVMLKFIAGSDSKIVTTESTWGNYNNTNNKIQYEIGRGRFAKVIDSNGATEAFKTENEKCQYRINTTAISEDVKQKNLYDVAGNLWEWTTEADYSDTTERYILRGGSFFDSHMGNPACQRGNGSVNRTSTNVSFRPALYIK